MIIMKITLKDGSFKEYEGSMSVLDITKDISEGLARVACAGEVDGELVDLRTVVDKDCNQQGCNQASACGKVGFHVQKAQANQHHHDRNCRKQCG
mgnify:CR=1 FL=1